MTNVLNFSHPLTEAQLEQLCGLTATRREDLRVFNIPTHFDPYLPYEQQAWELVEYLPLSTEEMRSSLLLVNPPSFNIIALLVMNLLSSELDFSPLIIRLRPVVGETPPRYEVAQILEL